MNIGTTAAAAAAAAFICIVCSFVYHPVWGICSHSWSKLCF